MKTQADMALDRIEALLDDLELMHSPEYGQASDREAKEIVSRILRKRAKNDWQPIGKLASKIVKDLDETQTDRKDP